MSTNPDTGERSFLPMIAVTIWVTMVAAAALYLT